MWLQDYRRTCIRSKPQQTKIPEPIDNLAIAVQSTQQQLATQLQKIQEMMQAIQMQYAAAPKHAHQDYGGCG